jgi:hypothetical protein
MSTAPKNAEPVRYRIRIKGMDVPDGTISVRALVELLNGLTECAGRGLRLVIEGASTKSGRTPVWLEKAIDWRIVGLAKGSTTLDVEAPPLGQILGAEVQQQDFWLAPPEPSDTALSLFSRSIRDTTAENLESDYYDAGLLSSLLDLKPFLKTYKASVDIASRGKPQDHVVLGMDEMTKAERLKVRTPEPKAFVVAGHLDWIQHSKKKFQLVLPDKQIIPGRIDEEYASTESLREMWGKDVTIRGMVYFKPSGRIHLLAAQIIRPKARGDEVFEHVPRVQTEAQFASDVVKASEHKGWLRDVWGKWPGDESIEELLAGLKR